MTSESGATGQATTGDTIGAIATPPGRGALAIVRVSGCSALEIAARIIRPWPNVPRQASLARAYGADGEPLDQGVALYFDAPASFTGEPVVEFTCHGGPIVSASVLAAFVAAGVRPAQPGEFTRRAVLNGKIDLIQAEAIGDLIDASTRSAQRIALNQLDGGLSRRIGMIRSSIVALEALAAYDIDFPEEDDGPVPPSKLLAVNQALVSDLRALLATAPMGEIVREGAVVVIAGAPNAGKSSLFNALLGRRRAIVTDIPGTTRDALEAVAEADGWPIRLVDTAGLRENADLVERLGIEVSREYLARANVIIACGDSAESLQQTRDAISQMSQAPIVGVRTKADLMSRAARDGWNGGILVSAERAEGLQDVTAAVARALASATGGLVLDAPLVTRERHRHGIGRALDELVEFEKVWKTGVVPATVAAVHLREATRHLEELIGVVDVEDVLDQLFRAFCVGK